MQLSDFITKQNKTVADMHRTIGRAECIHSEVSDLQRELKWRKEHGEPFVYVEETDRQISILLDGKREAVKSLLCQYAELSRQLVEGMEAFESANLQAA